MSTFDIRPDAPGMLRIEAVNITIKFDRTGPTTGRISWNIPSPGPGCSTMDQAYCGMLVTIDNKPASADKIPQRGEVYSSDATADSNLFAGDKLGSAMIIGAFYEDRTTTFFDITGLKPNTPYYVSGFPVDCQYRYFIEGVHAYSLDFTNRGTEGTHGSQVVVLNADAQAMGVNPDQYTGLHAGEVYDFMIQLGVDPKPQRPVDSTEAHIVAPRYHIQINGELAQSYTQLVAAINKQLALLKTTTQGPTAPGTGSYYFNTIQKKLFQWNGSEHIEIPVLVEPTQPNTVVIGTHWHKTTTDETFVWSGVAWILVSVLKVARDPLTPTADKSFWYNGTTAYEWNGVTWCSLLTFSQPLDPSLATTPPEDSFWYDTAHSILYRWNSVAHLWVTTQAVQATTNPNTPATGSYWFNNLTNDLWLRGVPLAGWNLQVNVAITEIAPATPAAGKLWYKPTTKQLFLRDLTNTTWTPQVVIIFGADPTIRSSCDLWWDTTQNILNVWSITTSTWIPSSHFFQQITDPSAPPVLAIGTAWYNTTTKVLYVYDNNCFVVVDFTAYPTDPRLGIVDGTVWYNTSTKVWSVRTSGVWVIFDPVDSPIDPNNLAVGTFWYNTTTSGLSSWNGIGWVAVTFSATPLTPLKGALWFDTTANYLKQWNGVMYVAAIPYASVELDTHNNLLFTDATVGSTSYVNITDGTLFAGLELVFALHTPVQGSDGASDTPGYAELGIGTDGSDAARNAILTDIRYELGYPVVDVELTKEQMDYAVDRALAELRSHSSLGYKRGFFFLSVRPNEQRMFLTNKVDNHHKIVDILGIYRLTSSFLASAHGAGVYGQIVLQHLYNMGSFDLLSYHLMAEYTHLMEILFAARVTFTWNEQTRELFMHNRFNQAEQMVCIEASVDRTEQDIMTDRYTKSWIRRYAAAVCRLMLAEIRGKFSTLPGAGGGVTLNAGELRQAAQTEIDACLMDIEQYITDRPEEYGVGSTFLFG
jgi:hypothetical protein